MHETVGKHAMHEARAAVIPDDDICPQYTFRAAWEHPLQLYLGEGAEDHLFRIEFAADTWNLALGRDLIEIVKNRRPRRFDVPESVWSAGQTHTWRYVDDGQSVMYIHFTDPATSHRGTRGFAQMKWAGDQIRESDIYIRTPETQFAAASRIVPFGPSHSVYYLVDTLYLTILHELGHALGLKHIGIVGNVMHPKPHDPAPWVNPLRIYAIAMASAGSTPEQTPLVFPKNLNGSHSFVEIKGQKMAQALNLFTQTASLGPQGGIAVMCLYPVD